MIARAKSSHSFRVGISRSRKKRLIMILFVLELDGILDRPVEDGSAS